MLITTKFELEAPVEAAWAYLLDVKKIAHCVPGAVLTEVVDDRTYEGKIEVKIGPIAVSYKGRITLQGVDETSHTVQVVARGTEARGRGGASASATAELAPSGEGTAVVMNTELEIRQAIADFQAGRLGSIAR